MTGYLYLMALGMINVFASLISLTFFSTCEICFFPFLVFFLERSGNNSMFPEVNSTTVCILSY